MEGNGKVLRDAEVPALLETVDQLAGLFETFTEARIFFRVAAGDLEGNPPTLADIVKLTGSPFSTTSRIVFALHLRGLLDYTNHATDRRKKILVPGKKWRGRNGKKKHD